MLKYKILTLIRADGPNEIMGKVTLFSFNGFLFIKTNRKVEA